MLRIENRFRWNETKYARFIPRKTSGRFAPVVRGVRSLRASASPRILFGAFAPDINGAGARAPISSITEGAGRGTDERILAASLLESMKLLY